MATSFISISPVGTNQTISDARSSVADGVRPDMVPTAQFSRECPRLCENPIDAMMPLLNRGGMMKGFVQGADRQQTTLLPECLDDWVDESNPVRAVDVFVDALELRDLGFGGVDPAATGRPAYHPSPMLKLYICLLYTSPSPRDRTRSRMPS